MDGPPRGALLLAVIIGSIIGGYIPTLFGAGLFSLWDIVGSTLGAFFLLYIAYKFFSS